MVLQAHNLYPPGPAATQVQLPTIISTLLLLLHQQLAPPLEKR
jgi:hypothetical protein